MFNTPEKIFITGATGFVGSHLVRRFIGGGAEVHILSRPNSDTWRINDIIQKIHRHDANIIETGKIKGILSEIQPTYIIHCANAGVYGGISVADEELIQVNLLGLVSLLSASDSVSYKGFINVGSSSEYGLKNRPMKETDICEPMNAYGVSKLAATLYASFVAHSRQRPIVTLRLFSTFGPYDDHRRLISRVILDILNHKEVKLANPNAVRDYIFIEDVVTLFLEVKEKVHSLAGEVFNVGFGKEYKISEVVEEIFKQMGQDGSVEWGVKSVSPWEPKKWEANMEKTLSSFTWRPVYSLERGIKKTIEWFTDHRGLYRRFES